MPIDSRSQNRVADEELVRVLMVICSPPNKRRRPQPGDRQDRYFDYWFDGGAIFTPTGGSIEYHFDDGVWAASHWMSPGLSLTIRWPDGRTVKIVQEFDERVDGGGQA